MDRYVLSAGAEQDLAPVGKGDRGQAGLGRKRQAGGIRRRRVQRGRIGGRAGDARIQQRAFLLRQRPVGAVIDRLRRRGGRDGRSCDGGGLDRGNRRRRRRGFGRRFLRSAGNKQNRQEEQDQPADQCSLPPSASLGMSPG
ncbi:MAG: hypothetical protein F4Z40_04675 [Chloroflexi bacterium]|nr:hypothetical protein [Chloroflexota bacterium]